MKEPSPFPVRPHLHVGYAAALRPEGVRRVLRQIAVVGPEDEPGRCCEIGSHADEHEVVIEGATLAVDSRFKIRPRRRRSVVAASPAVRGEHGRRPVAAEAHRRIQVGHTIESCAETSLDVGGADVRLPGEVAADRKRGEHRALAAGAGILSWR